MTARTNFVDDPTGADPLSIVDAAVMNDLGAEVNAKSGSSHTHSARSATTTSSATPTINFDNVDVFGITAQAVDITNMSTNLTYASPANGDRRLIYITGTASREINWGSAFEGPLPFRTNGTTRLDVQLVYNGDTGKWHGLNVRRDVWNITSSATPAADLAWTEQLNITALSTAITSLSSGLTNGAALRDGDPFIVAIKDDGTARAITLGATWVAQGVTAPTTTVVSKWLYLAAKWRSADSKLVLMAVSQEA